VSDDVQQSTWGLAILGLDVVSFSILSLSAFVPAGRFLLSFKSYHQLLVINLASVPGRLFSKSQHRQALDVVRNFFLKSIIIIAAILLAPLLNFGQKYIFSSDGKAEQSHLFYDTVVKVKFSSTEKIIFERYNNQLNDSTNLSAILKREYPKFFNDSTEYFLLLNLTDSVLKFSTINKRFISEEYSRYENFGFKSITFFISPKCGFGFNHEDVILKPSEVMIMNNGFFKQPNDFSTKSNCFMKVMSESNNILVSTSYQKRVGSSSFYISDEFKLLFSICMKPPFENLVK